MQKALQQMNVQLHHVLSDVTGVSGLAIIQAIWGPAIRSNWPRWWTGMRASQGTIQKALVGDYRTEHFLCSSPPLNSIIRIGKMNACDEQIVRELAQLPDPVGVTAQPLPVRKEGRPARADQMAGQDLRAALYPKLGVDLTAIEGIGSLTALVVLTEVGPDLSRFPIGKAFCFLVGSVSRQPNQWRQGARQPHPPSHQPGRRCLADGGDDVGEKPERSGRISPAMKARLGAAEAITATAHKLAPPHLPIAQIRRSLRPARNGRLRERFKSESSMRCRKLHRSWDSNWLPNNQLQNQFLESQKLAVVLLFSALQRW